MAQASHLLANLFAQGSLTVHGFRILGQSSDVSTVFRRACHHVNRLGIMDCNLSMTGGRQAGQNQFLDA